MINSRSRLSRQATRGLLGAALLAGCPSPDPDDDDDASAPAVECTAEAWSVGWERVGDGPVLAPQGWEDDIVRPTAVVPVSGGLRLYYLAAAFEPCSVGECIVRRWGLATSADGLVWQRVRDTPVLDLWADGEVDASHGAVHRGEAGWTLWYSRRVAGIKEGIAPATSPDGIEWTPSDGLALGLGVDGAWDDGSSEGPAILPTGDVHRLWYTGFSGEVGGIGLAELDGEWARATEAPVLGPGPAGSYTELGASHPSVVEVGGCLVLSFTAISRAEPPDDETIGIAVSEDGVTWERGAAPALVRSDGWDRDGVVDAALWADDEWVWMLYTGARDDGRFTNSIGLARKPIPRR